MPIVVKPKSSQALGQGDVLVGLPFVRVGTGGNLEADVNVPFLMVVSRPCQALRESDVVVAAVREWPLDLDAVMGCAKQEKGCPDLDSMRRSLAAVRDGGAYSNRFYLGDLKAGTANRYAADLCMLETIRVPVDGARAGWIAKHRIWCMDSEFARDLHVRIFNTYSRMGFDDQKWLSDPDLNRLISEGEGQLADAQRKWTDAKRAMQERESRNLPVPEKMQSDVERARKVCEQITDKLRPYQVEREARSSEKVTDPVGVRASDVGAQDTTV